MAEQAAAEGAVAHVVEVLLELDAVFGQAAQPLPDLRRQGLDLGDPSLGVGDVLEAVAAAPFP